MQHKTHARGARAFSSRPAAGSNGDHSDSAALWHLLAAFEPAAELLVERNDDASGRMNQKGGIARHELCQRAGNEAIGVGLARIRMLRHKVDREPAALRLRLALRSAICNELV